MRQTTIEGSGMSVDDGTGAADAAQGTTEAPSGDVAAPSVRRRRVKVAEPVEPATVEAPTEEEAPAAPLPEVPSVFGRVPAGATAWGCRKLSPSSGTWAACSWAAPGASVALREWPLGELSVEALRERFGPGIYQVQWFRTDDHGGRVHVAYGRTVEVLPVAPVEAPAPSPPLSPAASGLAEALHIMSIIDANANAKIVGMSQLAQAIGGGSRGLDAASLAAILEAQQKTMVAAIETAVAPLRAALAEGDDDDDDDGGGIGSVAAAAAGAVAPVMKGKGVLPVVVNMAAANPELARHVLGLVIPAVAELAGKVVEAFGSAAKKTAASPPVQIVRRVEAPAAAPVDGPAQQQAGPVVVMDNRPAEPATVGNDWMRTAEPLK